MKCPNCGNLESRVLDSRPSEDGTSIRRRRECQSCGRRFTTFETIETTRFAVVKKNGTREMFDKQKLINCMMKACDKRSVSIKQIEAIVNDIESILQSTMRSEIPSSEIGELVMQKLKDLDEVAYVRFASVYRQFKDISSFMEELKKILGE